MGDFIQSAGRSAKVWKEPAELPPGPNNRNLGVPPLFCSISAEQRAVTSKRDWLSACGDTVLEHGRECDGQKCIQLLGGFLWNPSWQFGWGTSQNHQYFMALQHRGVFAAEQLSAFGGCWANTQKRENPPSAAQHLHGCLQSSLSSREWPQLRLLRSGSKH